MKYNEVGVSFSFLSRIWSFGCVFLYTLGVGGGGGGELGRITHTNVALSVYKLPFCIILYVLRVVAFQFKRLCYPKEKDITRDGGV